MIRLENVTKFYGHDVCALRDASFDVNKGEFVFLVGPSGSGKSTLLRLLNRQERPEAGNVMVAGRNIVEMPSSRVPAAAPQHRQRVPGLQAAAQPHGVRERRLRPGGDRQAQARDPPAGPGGARPRRPRRQGGALPRPAVRRRAAARVGGQGVRQPAADPPRRRADRATSTRRRARGSCACSTASTRSARPC